MAKLTRVQRAELNHALTHLKRGFTYLHSPRVAVCRIGGPATTTMHMTRPLDGEVFYQINKECGSDLCGIEEALRRLSQFLNTEMQT